MGKKLVRSLVDTAVTNSAATGPCSFVAFEGEIAGRMVKVLVEEPEEDAKLLGPACMNEIFVYKGAVLGVPDTEKFAEIRKNELQQESLTFLPQLRRLQRRLNRRHILEFRRPSR